MGRGGRPDQGGGGRTGARRSVSPSDSARSTNAFERLDAAHREALRVSIALCIDQAFGDIASLLERDARWDELLFLPSALPNRPFYVERYSPLFAKQFLVCLITVAAKLTSGRPFTLASVAEEMALYAIIENTEVDEVEYDFDDFIDEVFEDTDFLFMFEEDTNGIQHTPIQKALGSANLDFEHWFRPFRDEDAVHPYVAPDVPQQEEDAPGPKRTDERLN